MIALSTLVESAKRPLKRSIRRRILTRGVAPAVSVGQPSFDHVPVAMCLYNRPERLEPMLRSLAAQTGVAGVDVYLWNNARRDEEHYENVVRSVPIEGALRSVQLVRSPFNLGSIARFYHIRALAQRGYRGPAVIVDDDEDIADDFLADCLAAYRPDAVTAWWAFQTGDSYWDRRPAEPGERVDHIGPGGMVCSAELFLDDAFFTDLPERYWLLDDLWLTYYAKRRGLTLAKLDVEIDFVLPETNQHHLNPLKDEFFRYLYPAAASDTARP
jgi:hypothetical protein